MMKDLKKIFLFKIKSFRQKAINLIVSIENSKVPISYFVATLFFFILFRNFFDHFSGAISLSSEGYTHIVLWFIFMWLIILLALKLFLNVELLKLCKLLCVFFSIVFLGPVYDIFSNGFGGNTLAYTSVSDISAAFYGFLHFFGEFPGQAATIGMRIHILVVLVGTFLYALLKTKRDFLKSFFTVFFVLLGIYIAGIFPSLFRIAGYVDLSNQPPFLTHFLFLFSVTIAVLLFAVSKKELFKLVIKDIRYSRLVYYILMLGFGIALGVRHLKFGDLSSFLSLEISLLVISMVCAFVFSIITNNFADCEIDEVCNRDRPLFRKGFSRENYKALAVICFCISLASALLVSFVAFLLVSLGIGLYFIYSMPPIRLKRIPVLSKLVLSINSLLYVFLGFSLFFTNDFEPTFAIFPREVIIFFLGPVTLAANFIDIKDYEGDLRANIKTLPVLLGLERAKVVIAIFFATPFLYLSYIFPHFLIPSIFCICVTTILITRKKYKEKDLFAFFLILFLVFIFYLLLL